MFVLLKLDMGLTPVAPLMGVRRPTHDGVRDKPNMLFNDNCHEYLTKRK